MPTREDWPAKHKADNLRPGRQECIHASDRLDIMTTDVVNTIVASDEKNVNNLGR